MDQPLQQKHFLLDFLHAGENANVAYFNGAWRLLRWNDQWHGNWTGEYATPELALAALQQEIILPTIC